MTTATATLLARYSISGEPPRSLYTLMVALERYEAACRRDAVTEDLDYSDLPTFGGEPIDQLGVYSWDAARVLRLDNNGWAIVTR